VLHAASWKYTGPKKSPKIPRLRTIAQFCRAISSQLRHVSTIEKKLVKQKYLLHMSYNRPMANFGPERLSSIGVFGATQQISTGFRVLASLLQRRRSTGVSQTLHRVWPSPGLVHYIYILGSSCPLTEFCSVTARHSSSGRHPNFVALSKGRHLYSAGRPSRWALAHILVSFFSTTVQVAFCQLLKAKFRCAILVAGSSEAGHRPAASWNLSR